MYRYPTPHLNDTFTPTNSMNCAFYFKLDPPYLFNMTSDPGENNPIDINSDSKYQDVISAVAKAKENHRNSIPHVESSLTFAKILWYPHLLSCCNFPFCSCMEEKYKTQDIK